MVKLARAEAQHSSSSPSWGTPGKVIDLARNVLGRIDLDPFTAAGWNEAVGAEFAHDVHWNSFDRAWLPYSPKARDILESPDIEPGSYSHPRTALVNPPGDPRGKMVKDAWRLTEWHHRTGWLGAGSLWVAFNIGQLQTLQRAGYRRAAKGRPERLGCPRSPLHRDFLRCIPRCRLRFESAPGIVGDAPPHASALVLLPAHGPLGDLQRAMFTGLAGEIGEVF